MGQIMPKERYREARLLAIGGSPGYEVEFLQTGEHRVTLVDPESRGIIAVYTNVADPETWATERAKDVF